MANHVVVAVDAEGGDGGSVPVLQGVTMALESDSDLSVLLCGQKHIVEEFSAKWPRCESVICGSPIEMGEHPAEAVKLKKDSSIVKGCDLVKERKAQGFFSAGSTGACLVAATLHIGRLKGVKRPALAIMIPSLNSPTLLLDVGANADCKVDYITQFAIMGRAYMTSSMGITCPSVGLLNIGSEPTKGSTFAQEAFDALSSNIDTFSGNCESSDLLNGKFDVVVTDGFTGNICLKTIEASCKFLLSTIKEEITSTAASKVGALLSKKSFSRVKDKISPDKFGGSPLLGVDGVCLIGHGASSPEAIKYGILATAREIRNNVNADILDLLNQDKDSI